MKTIDESRENIRNKLLTYETEEYERKLLAETEAARRAKLAPLTIHQRISVDDVLNFGSSSTTELVPSSTDIISRKGVLQPPVSGTVRFSDYTMM